MVRKDLVVDKVRVHVAWESDGRGAGMVAVRHLGLGKSSAGQGWRWYDSLKDKMIDDQPEAGHS